MLGLAEGSDKQERTQETIMCTRLTARFSNVAALFKLLRLWSEKEMGNIGTSGKQQGLF
jgi:hypothetical protein